MAIPSRTRLQRYFAELQKIEEHRSLDAEKKIQKLYKEMLTNLQSFIGVGYAKYAEDDKLTYATLAKKGEYARFLEEVQAKVNYIAPQVNKVITEVVKDIYKLAYEGMVNAVAKSVNDKDLEKLLSGIHLTPAQVIKAAVNNPVNKLTLSKTLEKNRKEIVYNIKQTVTVGIMNGDSMPTMAKKIQNDVDQNYRKAMLITRTEVHRVRETGHNDSAKVLDDKLAEADYKYRMCKEWRSKQDRVTRHTRLANHVKMHGKIVLQDEDFDLGNGVTAPCPGQSGKAYHDCNCRCRISRDLLSDEEFFEKTGRHFPKAEVKPPEKDEEKPKAEKKPKQAETKETQPKFTPAKTIQEAEQYARKFGNNVSYKGAKNLDNINTVNETLDELTSKYPIDKLSNVSTNSRLTKASARANYKEIDFQTKWINGNTDHTAWEQTLNSVEKNIEKVRKQIAEQGSTMTANYRKQLEKYIRNAEEYKKYSCWTIDGRFSDAKQQIKGTITHEYGHVIADQYIGQINGKRVVSNLAQKTTVRIDELKRKIYTTYKTAKSNGDIYKISMYASTDEYEFFAESFCALEMGVELPEYITEMLKEVISYGTM